MKILKNLKSEFDNNISSSEKVEIVRKGSMKVNIREVDKNDEKNSGYEKICLK